MARGPRWQDPSGRKVLQTIVKKVLPWIDGLRPVQEDLVAPILDGEDILCCTATALIPSTFPTRLHPVGLVVTPTKGLANNIVSELTKLGITALAYCRETLADARRGGIDLATEIKECTKWQVICVDPEHLRGNEWRIISAWPLFRSRLLFAGADEVHLINEWGTDFRISFKLIGLFVRGCLPTSISVFGLSATLAPGKDTTAVCETLGLYGNSFRLIRRSNEPPNIQFILQPLTHGLAGYEFPDLLPYLLSGRKTCIHCPTIDMVFRVYVYIWRLQARNADKMRRTHMYHSLCSPAYNEETLRLIDEDPHCQIVIATIAFSNGINAKAILDSISLGFSSTLDIVLQEKGRAGRETGSLAPGVVLVQPTTLAAAKKQLQAPATPTAATNSVPIIGIRWCLVICAELFVFNLLLNLDLHLRLAFNVLLLFLIVVRQEACVWIRVCCVVRAAGQFSPCAIISIIVWLVGVGGADDGLDRVNTVDAVLKLDMCSSTTNFKLTLAPYSLLVNVAVLLHVVESAKLEVVIETSASLPAATVMEQDGQEITNGGEGLKRLSALAPDEPAISFDVGTGESEAQYCSGCKTTKPAEDFGTTSTGRPLKTCLVCTRRTRDAKRKQKEDQENIDPDADTDEEDFGRGLGMLPLNDFLDALTQQDVNLKLQARIGISFISGSRRQRADALAAAIRNKMKYRFVKRDHKQAEFSRYMYHCAQNASRQHAPKKNRREGAKPHDKIAMDAFPCKGWLHITITNWDEVAFVKIAHVDEHIPYWKIDIPPTVIEFVQQNSKLTPTQLWDEVLKMHPNPSFTRKAIYAIWADINSSEWKRDPDELKSANILLDEFSRSEPILGSWVQWVIYF
ncbi:hypothetical protein B0H17DRAFT_1205904 [Mycena rosella]|uniref:DNA 3'-5' helicase n=1 Tax=Mycena rosella TaxID=1033263 RepID=A0AAD7G9U7_MYCRO|nr:hypothetical protein B0H17DRAFT_1205904 [Mycena rosella]